MWAKIKLNPRGEGFVNVSKKRDLRPSSKKVKITALFACPMASMSVKRMAILS